MLVDVVGEARIDDRRKRTAQLRGSGPRQRGSIGLRIQKAATRYRRVQFHAAVPDVRCACAKVRTEAALCIVEVILQEQRRAPFVGGTDLPKRRERPGACQVELRRRAEHCGRGDVISKEIGTRKTERVRIADTRARAGLRYARAECVDSERFARVLRLFFFKQKAAYEIASALRLGC